MCGIFAYLNCIPKTKGEILNNLIQGLKRLEYRGYDSVGISVDLESSEQPSVFRAEGKIADFEAQLMLKTQAESELLEERLESHCGIAHTRWATHGPPSERNSHPQSSGPGNEFVVVHNGILTNYRALKESLIRKGFEFESDTDTEVIPKLAKFIYDQLEPLDRKRVSFRQLCMEVVRHLEGAFALIFKSSHFPGELVACRRGSPLILGVKEAEGDEHVTVEYETNGHCSSPTTNHPYPRTNAFSELFLASDASAVVEHTKSVIFLEDEDVVHLRRGMFTCYKFPKDKAKAGGNVSDCEGNGAEAFPLGEKVQRALHKLEMEVEQIMKGSFDHFMQKEIHEQPISLTETMRGRVHPPPVNVMNDTGVENMKQSLDSSDPKIILGGVREYLTTIRRSRRLIFVGCGTSYHSCLCARQSIEELTELPVVIELASDFVDRQCPLFRDDTVFFISQSGETADTLAALLYARTHGRGALCVGITNTVGSELARDTDCGVHVNAGCEIGVASTKAYTSQVVVLVMIALALSEDSLSKAKLRADVIRDLALLPVSVKRALMLDDMMKTIAQELVEQQSLLVLGRGLNYATAMEAALKVKEVALMHSEGVMAGEMKHGVLALVDESLPVLVIAPKDRNFENNLNVILQLRARQGRLLILTTEEHELNVAMQGPGVRLIKVPVTHELVQPIVNIIPLQLLAYHLTVLRGFNVDQPRNLAKSVTVL